MQEALAEKRARRQLQELGYLLRKYRSRSAGTMNYGGYVIIDVNTNVVIGGTAGGLEYTLDLLDVQSEIKRLAKQQGAERRAGEMLKESDLKSRLQGATQ